MEPATKLQPLAHRAQIIPKARVLVVDDDPQDLEDYRRIFEERGYEVFTVLDYSQGLVTLDSRPVDFILLSQGSPAFEGRVVLERAIAIDRRLPVLVLARTVEMECYLEAMQLGAFDYLEKPVGAAELVRALETHVLPRSSVA